MHIKNYLEKIFLILACAYCISFFDGCTFARLFTKRPVTFITPLDSTTVLVEPGKAESWHKVNDHNYWLYDNRKKVSVHKKVTDVLTNSVLSYDIEQYKNGYFSSLTPITRTRFNGIKILDFAVPGLYLATLVSMNVNTDDPSYYPLYYYTIGIWFNFLPGPWATYKSTFRLPQLVPIKYREKEENRMYIGDVIVDSVNSFKPTDYRSFGAYRRHEQRLKRRYDEAVYNTHLDNIMVKDSLNRALRKWGYIDTTGLFSRLYSNSCIAKCEVLGHSDIYVDDYDCIIVKCLWKLYNPEGNKELFEFTSQDTSRWTSGSVEDSPGPEAVMRSMNEFLKTDEVIKLLKQNYTPTQPQKDSVSKTITTITLTAADTINTLQDALQAVVTIKQKNLFFSGCVISPDGYVVTNAHLIADAENSDLFVHFSNGDSSIAKFVRINSVYDLALYKIEKQGHYKCFQPDTSRNIKLGEEVYAIGTAEELNLKQTMTKGIVSGKRKIKDKQLIQTDASINRGTSGGALVNKNGHFIGIINTRLVGNDVQGIGFAVPAYYINDALQLNTH